MATHSEEFKPNGNGTTNSNQKMEAEKPITINLQFLKDLSFENPKAPGIFTDLKVQPKVEVSVNVEVQKLSNDEIYEVSLHFDIKALHNDEKVFIVDLKYAAIITLNNVPAEEIQPLLLVYCPNLLFPFARSIIADSTREGGFPPLLIDPVDFTTLYNQHTQQLPTTH